MNKTGIKWTELTWNPISGCTKVSDGCKFCYAKTIAERHAGSAAFPNGFALTLRPDWLVDPINRKIPALIFVNSMSDVFWDEVPQSMVDSIFDVIDQTPWHTYQILTKRADRMLAYSQTRRFPKNLWAGVTVENQATAGRLDLLRQIATDGKRMVSAEPLLSPLAVDWTGIDWVITGGESGDHLLNPATRASRGLVELKGTKWSVRPDRIDWVRQIRDDCKAAGAAFFHKQWGGITNNVAGRELDGRTWDEYP